MKLDIKQIAEVNVDENSNVRIDVNMFTGVTYGIVCKDEKQRDELVEKYSANFVKVSDA